LSNIDNIPLNSVFMLIYFIHYYKNVTFVIMIYLFSTLISIFIAINMLLSNLL
jgi:hypothetical protein